MVKSAGLPQSSSEGDALHRSERMFCLKDGKVFLAPPGIVESHLAWFKAERWIGSGDDDGEENFFHRVVSGYHVPSENALYCFREADFSFDPEVVTIVVRHLSHLTKLLHLELETKVFIGPRNSNTYIGTTGKLMEKTGEDERKATSPM